MRKNSIIYHLTDKRFQKILYSTRVKVQSRWSSEKSSQHSAFLGMKIKREICISCELLWIQKLRVRFWHQKIFAIKFMFSYMLKKESWKESTESAVARIEKTFYLCVCLVVVVSQFSSCAELPFFMMLSSYSCRFIHIILTWETPHHPQSSGVLEISISLFSLLRSLRFYLLQHEKLFLCVKITVTEWKIPMCMQE